MDLFSETQEDLTATIFADARPLAFDKDGRITLSQDLMQYAGITTSACFVGRGKTFQIWQKDAFEDYQKEARSRLKQTVIKTAP